MLNFGILVSSSLPFAVLKCFDNSIVTKIGKRSETMKQYIWKLEQKLLLAIQNNDIASADKLFQKGVDVDTRFLLGAQPKPAIYVAVERGHAEMVELLIKRGCSINQSDASGRTPLHVVAARGNVPLAKLLLKSRANVRAVSTGGCIPLHFAVAHHAFEIVKMLVDAGSDINRKDQLGQTPLILACQNQDPIVVEYLVGKGADVHSADFKGDTALMFAIAESLPDLKIIKMLIDAGAKVNHYNSLKETPLTVAISRDSQAHADVVKLLLDKGCNLNYLSRLGHTPLQLALVQHKNSIAELLIRAGCDPNFEDCYGVSPLAYAGRLGNLKMAAILVAAGAKTRPRTLLKEVENCFLWDEASRQWLLSKSLQFPRLQDKCRIAFRTSLGRKADQRIKELGLPTNMKRFLCFEDLDV